MKHIIIIIVNFKSSSIHYLMKFVTPFLVKIQLMKFLIPLVKITPTDEIFNTFSEIPAYENSNTFSEDHTH